MIFVIECFSRICTPALRAFLEPSNEPRSFGHDEGRRAAQDVPFHCLVSPAGIRRRSASTFFATGELDAVSQQELERRGIFVGELADDVAVAVQEAG